MIAPEKFEVLTFDCYGTLIDWETGILTALRRVLSSHEKSLPDSEILELYGEFEAEAEAGPYQKYQEVLTAVVCHFGGHLGFTPTSNETSALVQGLPTWQPWPDTVAALRRLQSQFRLAVISNIDDDLFAETRDLLGVEFAHVITAQQTECYKPGLRIFHHALAKLNVPPNKVLHIGQSLYHDVQPAKALGISTVWVNRPSRRANVGAVRRAHAAPDLEVSNMKTLADTLLSM